MRMPYLFSACLCFCLLGAGLPPVHAQQWHAALKRAQKTAQKTLVKNNGQIHAAIKQSAARAQKMHASFKPFSTENAFVNSFILFDNSHGKTTSAAANGWKLNENREWLIQRILHEKTLRQIAKQQNKWESFLKSTPPLAPRQLAQLIPADKKYIFMGEYHEELLSLRLQQTIADYARLHPATQVIVFSEFAYDTQTSLTFQGVAPDESLIRYTQNNIRWVGLEEKLPPEISRLIINLSYHPVEVSLQGLKARNTHWAEIIKSYRAKYPDAVFFIHSGSLHSDYQEPFSVSAALNPEESFVMQFIPALEHLQNYEKFHLVTRGKYLRPGTLIWQNPQYARMAGFNVQVILPLDE